MIFGAITNSWRLQLQDQSLMDLVAQAEGEGRPAHRVAANLPGRVRIGRG